MMAGVSISSEASFTLTSVVDAGGIRTAVFTLLHQKNNTTVCFSLKTFTNVDTVLQSVTLTTLKTQTSKK